MRYLLTLLVISTFLTTLACQSDECFEESCEFETSNTLIRGPQPNTFISYADTKSSVEACDDGFNDDETACYNELMPPAPLIKRSMIAPEYDLRGIDLDNYIDQNLIQSTSSKYLAAERTSLLPEHNTTVDGRLVSKATGIAVFRPENLSDGFQTIGGKDQPAYNQFTDIRLFTQINPTDDTTTRLSQAELEPTPRIQHDGWSESPGKFEGNRRGTFHNICNESGIDDRTHVFACQAKYEEDEPYRAGDCYNVTTLWTVSNSASSELRSLKITIFVPDGKNAKPLGDFSKHVWVYPRFNQPSSNARSSSLRTTTPILQLPAYKNYDVRYRIMQDVPPGRDWIVNDDDPSKPPTNYQKFYYKAFEECGGSHNEPWCRLLNEQKVHNPAEPFLFYDGEVSDLPVQSTERSYSLAEPTTTADGMLLIVNDSRKKNLMYSYNDVGPCDARGWHTFYPISRAYLDPNVNTRYGFAIRQMRKSSGELYAPGETVKGLYPWVDRKGNNLLYSTHGYKDGLKLYKTDSGAQFSADAKFDRQNTAGVIVMGSWTNWKEVVPDNGLNHTDFTFKEYNKNTRFNLKMYRYSNKTVLPVGSRRMNSVEHVFNHYDVMTPLSPFDVVWMVSSSENRNAELVFDEYMNPDALVVAHMNSPITYQNNGSNEYGSKIAYPRDGFKPYSGSGDEFKGIYNYAFAETPRLQNASTIAHQARLYLKGGAIVPPIAEGGVLGKGVYLDGENDRIEIENMPQDAPNYYLGLWVNPHRPNSPQTLYQFASGSQIVVSESIVSFVTPDGVVEASVNISGHLPENSFSGAHYFHLGISCDGFSGEGVVTIFINGNVVGTDIVKADYSLANESGEAFTVSQRVANSSYAPYKGYLDELRIYRLREEIFTTGYFEEYACNLAMGSLSQTNGCEQIDLLHSEDVDENGVGRGNDFPLQAYLNKNCGNAVHKNHGLNCRRGVTFEIEDKHLVATMPRPDFSSTPFCLTCHVSQAHPVPGLRLDALSTGLVSSQNDHRRQPMMWPQWLSGRVPQVGDDILSPMEGLKPGDYMDEFFLGERSTDAPIRIESLTP